MEEIKLFHLGKLSETLGNGASELVRVQKESLETNELAQMGRNRALEVIIGEIKSLEASTHDANAFGDGSRESIGAQKESFDAAQMLE